MHSRVSSLQVIRRGLHPFRFLADSTMQKIRLRKAQRDRFVVPRADGDFDCAGFTPKIEDELCGHADLGIRLCARAAEAQGVAGSLPHLQRYFDRRSGQDSFEMDFPASHPNHARRQSTSCQP